MVLRNRTEFCFLAVLLVIVVGMAAGCSSKPAQDTKTSALPQVGIIDTPTAVKNHPKYAQLQRLNQEYDALVAQVQAEGGQAGADLPPSLNGPAGQSEAAAREFNAKMAAKERELKTGLEAADVQERQSSQTELNTYVSELDKDYQPQIFSLQLKLKTVQLSKEDAAAPQAELERLQSERAAKIAAKQQELLTKLEQTMTAKQADARHQLDAYGQQLSAAVAGDQATEKTNLAAAGSKPDATLQAGKQQQLAMKQQEITALQDLISSDVRDKAAKVAAEKGLEAVFADVRLNVSAVDVTTAVIAEFKI